ERCTTLCAGVNSRRCTSRRVPNEIGIDRHAVIMAVELGEALSLIYFFRMPFTPGEFAECSPGKAQDGRNAQKRQLIELAIPQLANFLRADARLFCQLGIGDAQTVLRFADDVADVVFE